MRRQALAFIPVVLTGLAMAGCSVNDVPGDSFGLSVHNPTPAAQSRTQPDLLPGQDPYNRTIPTP
jgi:hypothetical protein